MKNLGKSQKIVAIIQARMGSSRLPGKTLADIMGKPLLYHIVQRIKASKYINEIIIATTTESIDQAIVKFARENNLLFYKGSVNDVLDRFYNAATRVNADIVVRITADDPFKDPVVIDKVIKHLITHPELDYVSNTIKPTYPEGLDVEVLRSNALKNAYENAKLRSEREHVTPFIWKNPEIFNVANVENDEDLSHYRWTLDYEEDLEFARKVYSGIYKGEVFLLEDILSFLKENPQVSDLNKGIVRNEGYMKSLNED